MRRLKFFGTTLATVAMLAALLWLLSPMPYAQAQDGISNLDTLVLSNDLLVGDDITLGGNLSVAGVIATSGVVTDGNLVLVGNLSVAGTSNLAGNVSDSSGALTVADSAMIDGQADAVQLTVQGNATNTNNVFVVENSAGTDQFTVGNTGNAVVTGNATVGSKLILTPAAVITVTNGATLSPTGSYQPIASAGAVGFGAITAATAGTVLTLVNTVNQTITITDGTTVVLSGNIALGQYDSLVLISDGTRWIMRSTSNN